MVDLLIKIRDTSDGTGPTLYPMCLLGLIRNGRAHRGALHAADASQECRPDLSGKSPQSTGGEEEGEN